MELNWTSVEDGLPKDDGQVLVADWYRMDGTQHIGIATFRSGSGLFSGYKEDDITHWMPLPLPPSDS